MIPRDAKNVIVFGGEGIGVIAASTAQALGFRVKGFLNDAIPTGSEIGRAVPLPVLGRSTSWSEHLDGETVFIVAFGAMQRSESALQLIESLGIPPAVLVTLISPSAHLDTNYVRIGNGSLLAAGSHISVDASLGNHCAIMGSAYLGHDSEVNDFSRLAAGSVVGAYCRIGRGVHVGTNATIRERVAIGDFSLIGAGSVVLSDVPDRSIVVGNPGRVLRTLEKAQR